MPRKLISAAQIAGRAVLQLIYPEVCLYCGAEYGETKWYDRGAAEAGMQWCDGPHLCAQCAPKLAPQLVTRRLPRSQTPVVAGRTTGPDLVAAIAQWKYHGIRGLAWPLSQLLRPALDKAVRDHGPVDYLIPIPLHKSRQRARGFNQAEMVARLAAPDPTLVNPALLRRIRSTDQQAKLATESAREHNLVGAFKATMNDRGAPTGRLGLVDDLVTGGMTCEAAISALVAAGWQVSWVVCLGLAWAKSGQTQGQVDSSAAEI